MKKFINSQYGDQENRVWVISSDPPSGTRISGKVPINLELGYQLTGLPYANLGVSFWLIGKDTGKRGGSIPIKAGEGVVHMSLPLDTDNLAEGAWEVATDLGTYIDAGPGFAINDLTLFDTQWCVRCDPALLPTQPAVLGTYWRPSIHPVLIGQVAEGYQIGQVSVSPTHVLLHQPLVKNPADLPQTVETDPVDLTGLVETHTFKVQLKLPGQGSLIGQQTVEVRVEVVPGSP